MKRWICLIAMLLATAGAVRSAPYMLFHAQAGFGRWHGDNEPSIAPKGIHMEAGRYVVQRGKELEICVKWYEPGTNNGYMTETAAPEKVECHVSSTNELVLAPTGKEWWRWKPVRPGTVWLYGVIFEERDRKMLPWTQAIKIEVQ